MRAQSTCKQIGPRSAAVIEAARAWYAEMQDRLRSKDLGPADVVMSWQSRFRPIASRLAGSPTQAQIDAGTCFQGADGGWWIILAEDVAVTGPARPRLDQEGSKGHLTFLVGRGGGYVIRDGEIVRDASAVVGSPSGDDQLEALGSGMGASRAR